MAAPASSVEQFEGFSDDAIQFFLDLQAEQSRTWFKAHQDDFTRLCRRPLELFFSELIERLSAKTFPKLSQAEPHYFRIQRDTRFAKDKAPYKTYVAANVAIRPPRDGEEDHAIPGIYVSFGLEGEFIGVGAWHMSPETLARFRQMLDDNKSGARIQKEIDALRGRGFGVDAMEKLKRVPSPYAQDHPRAELLKHKGLAVTVQPEAKISSSRAYLDWAEARLTAAAPLVLLLDKSLSGRA